MAECLSDLESRSEIAIADHVGVWTMPLALAGGSDIVFCRSVDPHAFHTQKEVNYGRSSARKSRDCYGSGLGR